jgi:hypothetical protein
MLLYYIYPIISFISGAAIIYASIKLANVIDIKTGYNKPFIPAAICITGVIFSILYFTASLISSTNQYGIDEVGGKFLKCPDKTLEREICEKTFFVPAENKFVCQDKSVKQKYCE